MSVQLFFRRSLILSLVWTTLFVAGCNRPEAPVSSAMQAPPANGNWEGQLVRRPGDTPEDSKVYLVKDGKKHWVVSGDWLKLHGFKFPEDVHMVSVDELGRLQNGEPYQ